MEDTERCEKERGVSKVEVRDLRRGEWRVEAGGGRLEGGQWNKNNMKDVGICGGICVIRY